MSSRGPMRRHQRLPWLLLQRFMKGLLRVLFQLLGRRSPQAGFVFPSTVLLVVMVTLTAGALTYRAFSRSSQVIVERQQQVIINAATPAVDRAKAKVEYLFGRDLRPSPKVPPSDAIENLLRATDANMLEDGDPGFTGEYDRLAIQALPNDIYTLDDETRVDLNGDGIDDNAWIFNTDVNGDPDDGDADEFVVYSVLVDHLNNDIGFVDNDALKADNLVARNSPLTAQANSPCVRQTENQPAAILEEPISGEGWSRINAIRTEKTIQVNAFAIDLSQADEGADKPVSTLEFQQIREAALANKWGAWFRYDLEATPGPEFNWNGAMHTQGSLFMANNFNAYMISSTASCAYDDGASELTLGAANADNEFEGQLVIGHNDLGFTNAAGRGPATIHLDDANNPAEPAVEQFSAATDSITTEPGNINDIYLDPVQLHLNDISTHIGFVPTDGNTQDPATNFPGRVRNLRDNEDSRISLDDTFRADNRFGPSSVYDRAAGLEIPDNIAIGENIAAVGGLNADQVDALTRDGEGLDGYWERRAVDEGMRLIVGQRLELGNAYGWNYSPVPIPPNPVGTIANSDPLYPPTDLPTIRTAEHYQRKLLRDNLAAVQGMVVYHYETGNGLAPVVCLATTAHHGTYEAIANSRTFRQRIDGNGVMLDFLTGNGTNGWEFDPVDPDAGQMPVALDNLANFAGDPSGGGPSFEPVQDTEVHPFPYMAMWGDFATLRRVEEGQGNGSIADQSTRETAACTLALLAYNINAVIEEEGAVNATFAAADFTGLANALDGSGLDLVTAPLAEMRDAVANADQRLLLDVLWHHWVVLRDRTHGFINDNPLAVVCDATSLSTRYTALAAGAAANTVAEAVCKDRPHFPALYYIFPVANHDGDGTAGGADEQPPTEDYITQTVNNYGQNNNFNVVNIATLAGLAVPHGADAFDLPNPAPEVANAGFAVEWDNGDPPGDNTPDRRPWDVVVTNADGTNPDAFGVSVLDKIFYSGRENMPIRMLDLNVAELMDGQNVSDRWFAGLDAAGEEHFGLTYAFREDATREDAIVRPANGTFGNCDDYGGFYDDSGGTIIVAPTCSMITNTGDVLDWEDPPIDDAGHRISLKPVDYSPDPMRRPYGFRLRNGADFGRNGQAVGGTPVASGLSFISNNAVAIQGNFNLHSEGDPNVIEEEFNPPETVFNQNPEVGADAQGGAFYNAFYDRTDPNFDFADPGDDQWRPAEILGDVVYLLSGNFRDGFVEAGYASNAAGANAGTFQYNDAGNSGNGLVSFQNMNRPADGDEEVPGANRYLREGGPDDTTSPIYFDRNGHVYIDNTNQLDDYPPLNLDDDGFEYFEFNVPTTNPSSEEYRNANLAPASEPDDDRTTINALIISGTIPSRPGQIYGGLHNFPRFNESWEDETLQIAGGFFQLFFSHTSTGPYDMEAWEVDDVPGIGNNNRNIGYFWPPNRVWGYDVALQYAQQPPIASRFVAVGAPRSELYKELDVEDAYVMMLRCAANPITGANQIDPDAQGCGP